MLNKNTSSSAVLTYFKILIWLSFMIFTAVLVVKWIIHIIWPYQLEAIILIVVTFATLLTIDKLK